MDYTTTNQASTEFNERNDCAVKAVTIVTGLPYAQVHAEFAKAGRRNRCGTPKLVTTNVVKRLGFYMVDRTDEVQGKTVRAIQRELTEGNYLVSVAGHILAVKDGVVEDWTRNRLNRVKKVLLVLAESELGPVRPYVVTQQQRPAMFVGPTNKYVWKYADKVWNEKGCPTGSELRKLRITIMNVLGTMGIKRTTCSTELGKWQKSKGL